METGIFDDIKRRGTEPTRTVWRRSSGWPGQPHHYVFELGGEEVARARSQLVGMGIDLSRRIIGLNTGAGGRWPLKQWREDGYVELMSRLASRDDVQFLLLGGPGERERNDRLRTSSPVPVWDAGCENTVRHFAALLGHCDVVVSGDTLAMHVAGPGVAYCRPVRTDERERD